MIQVRPRAAVLDVVLVVGTAAAAVGCAGPPPSADLAPPASSSSTGQAAAGPVPGVFARNKRAARTETARVARLVPLPAGSRELPSRPDGLPDQPSSTGASDSALTTTTWWAVPVTVTTLRAYLRSHTPAGMPSGAGDGYSTGPDQPTVYFVQYVEGTSPAPTAYLPVSLEVDFVASGATTLVRASAYTEAHTAHPQAALVDPAEVVTVDVARVASFSPSGPSRPQPPIQLTAPTDAVPIRRLAATVDALPGSVRPLFATACPMLRGPVPSDTLTFTRADGSTIAFRLRPFCFGQVEVAVDGRRLRTMLDPGDLDDVLAGLPAAHSG